jgi:tRNA-guanine family transglycosylase
VSRGYIHHLLEAKEMLAEVLLAQHNLHHYMLFMAAVRAAAVADSVSGAAVTPLTSSDESMTPALGELRFALQQQW